MESKDDSVDVITRLIPDDSQIYYREHAGEIHINREGTRRKSMIFWSKIIPPHSQPNYSRNGLIEKLEKNEIQKGPIHHFAVFYNPTSRGGKGKKLVTKFQKKFAKTEGFTSEFFNSLDDDALKVEIGNCIKETDRCIVICGGDGTVNMMLNKIKDFCPGQDKSIPILVIPFGTGNDFYGSLGFNSQATIDKRLNNAIKLPLDLGEYQGIPFIFRYCKVHRQCYPSRKEPNVYMPDWIRIQCSGYDSGKQARVKMEFYIDFDSLFGKFKYKVGAFFSILKKKTFRYTLILDDNIVLKDSDFQIVRKSQVSSEQLKEIQNTQLVGGGLRLCPFAQLDDGLLDILLYFPLTRKRILDVFGNAKKNGSHVFESDCHYYRCKKIRVEFDQPTMIQIDGDVYKIENFLEASINPKLVSYLV